MICRICLFFPDSIAVVMINEGIEAFSLPLTYWKAFLIPGFRFFHIVSPAALFTSFGPPHEDFKDYVIAIRDDHIAARTGEETEVDSPDFTGLHKRETEDTFAINLPDLCYSAARDVCPHVLREALCLVTFLPHYPGPAEMLGSGAYLKIEKESLLLL